MKSETYFMGIDLGTQSSFWVIKTHEGNLIQRMKVFNDREAMEQALRPYGGHPLKAVIEATGNTYWMYHALREAGCEVVVAHPLKTRAIASAKVKNDRLDANVLADLLRADLIPQSYIPSEEVRALREMTRHHIALTQMRTRIKNRLHGLLVKLNLHPPSAFTNLLGRKGREWLRGLQMPEVFEFQKIQCLEQIDHSNQLLTKTDQKIKDLVKDFPRAERLQEIPGIGVLAAAILLAERGPIERFPSPKQLVSYAGMAPGLDESGKTSRARPITHEGNRYLRWILCEIVQHHIRRPGPLRSFHLRLKDKKGHSKALVATARKLLVRIYYFLKGEEAFSLDFAGYARA